MRSVDEIALRLDQRRQVDDAPEGHVLQIRRRFHGRRLRNSGREALRSLDGLAVGQPGMKCECGFGIERHIGLTQALVVIERLVHAAQHRVDLGILKLESHEFQRSRDLFLGDAHRLVLKSALSTAAASPGWCVGRRGSAAALLRMRLARGRKNRDQLEPGSSVHKFSL